LKITRRKSDAVHALAVLRYEIAAEQKLRAELAYIEALAASVHADLAADKATKLLAQVKTWDDPWQSFEQVACLDEQTLQSTLEFLHGWNDYLQMFLPDLDAVLNEPRMFLAELLRFDAEEAEKEAAEHERAIATAKEAQATATTRQDEAELALEVHADAVQDAAVELAAAIRCLDVDPGLEIAASSSPDDGRQPPIQLRHVRSRSVLTAAPPVVSFTLAA